MTGVQTCALPILANAGATALNEYHYFDCAQFEQSAAVTEFDEARQIHLTMKATRINEIVNPGFAAPLAPWAVTGASTSIDSSATEPETHSYSISAKQLTSNVATITTSYTHDRQVGTDIVVTGVGSPFDGTYTITTVGAKTISYARTNADIALTAATGTV